MGQLGGRVARAVERDSFVCLLTALRPNSPHPARVMRPQMDAAQNKAARSDARTSPSVPPGTEGGPSRPSRSRSVSRQRDAAQPGQESAAAQAAAATAYLQKLREYGGYCWWCHQPAHEELDGKTQTLTNT